jgi:hypothetical protein
MIFGSASSTPSRATHGEVRHRSAQGEEVRGAVRPVGGVFDGPQDDFKAAIDRWAAPLCTSRPTTGDPDFSAQLTNIKAKNPDAIFVPGYYTDVGNIALQARKLGITVPLLGGDGWDSDELSKIAGPAIDGSFYTNHYAPDRPTPEVVEFVSKYKAAYGGRLPGGLPALGYDPAKVLFDAMGRAASPGGKDLAAAIRQRGVQGRDPGRSRSTRTATRRSRRSFSRWSEASAPTARRSSRSRCTSAGVDPGSVTW